jgi:hypothetical protein
MQDLVLISGLTECNVYIIFKLKKTDKARGLVADGDLSNSPLPFCDYPPHVLFYLFPDWICTSLVA